MITYALRGCVTLKGHQKVNHCLKLCCVDLTWKYDDNDPLAVGLEDLIIRRTSSPGHSALEFSFVRCTQTICILNNSKPQCLK